MGRMSSSSFNPMALENRRVLVTGATSGVGQAVAVLLSHLGATVVCAGRDQKRLEQTMACLAGGGHTQSSYDLGNLSGISDWLATLGPLHGLVHAAGVQSVVPVRMLTPEKWRMVLLVNTEAALALAKAFLDRRVYAGEHGSIVFLSSVMGRVGTPGRVAYSLSKGALDGLTRSLALELAPRKIRVNCVAPAFVRTRMFDEMFKLWTDEQRAQVERLHPLGIGQPEDVAHAVAFLLADTGKWITGSVMVVDGGYTAQ
jgi:NAD(P)-dependent dehydrogenase (short-subunit alcohol dehydrogenase family)